MRARALFITPSLPVAPYARTPPSICGARPSSLRPVRPARAVHAHLPQRGTRTSATGPRMFDVGAAEIPDDPDEEETRVMLRDAATGRQLSCGVQHVVEHDGETYLLCYPLDDVVMFARAGEEAVEGELEAIDDEASVEALFPVAESVLKDEAVVLKNSAFFLTMDDMREALEEEEDEDEGEGGDDEDADDEDVEVLTNFEYEGESFLVVRPAFPVHLVAKEVGDDLQVLSGKELNRISAVIDENIYNQLFRLDDITNEMP